MDRESPITEEQIRAFIEKQEIQLRYFLCEEDKRFLVFAISSFLYGAINKFIFGAKEHDSDPGNSFLDVDHQHEITNELLDLWNYHTAMNYLTQCRIRARQEPPNQTQ